MRIVSIIGARPQFVKAAMVSRALEASGFATERLVHTGQHFDANMSDVFFRELGIPVPEINLGIGGGTHGQNTGRMIEEIEGVLLRERPDWVMVYGDTDSTLAGTLAAVKLHIPVAHIEAGLRSYNRRMPEEVNRVLTDHAASLLLAPTKTAVRNLATEGVAGDTVRLVGDVMYDAALLYARRAERESRILERLGIRSGGYLLATIHRPANTDNLERLRGILNAMAGAALPVVWPVHPRARKRLADFGLKIPPKIRAVDPVGYIDMVMLEKHARLIATDSGGVQKEAFFHRVPCVTIREETEWVELLELGVNRLVGDDWAMLARLLSTELPEFKPTDRREPYGRGDAAERIIEALRSARCCR